MKKKPNDSAKSKYLYIVLCIVCCGLIFLSFSVDMSSGPLRLVSGYVLTPIQDGLNTVGNWIADKGDSFQDSAALAEENARLKEEVSNLTVENNALLQDQEELSRLQELLSLKDEYSDYNMVGARITAKDTGNWFNVFTINKGSSDGIAVNCNVIADGGLVGIVTAVGPNWATVRSIIDDSSNVSAMVSKTSDTCVVSGDLRLTDEGKLRLEKLNDSEDKVSEGDKIVTSDISDRYLPGILIGYISEVAMDSNNLTKSGYVTPVVDFLHLREVLVILDLKDTSGSDSLGQTENEQTEMRVETETETESETAAAAQ